MPGVPRRFLGTTLWRPRGKGSSRAAPVGKWTRRLDARRSRELRDTSDLRALVKRGQPKVKARKEQKKRRRAEEAGDSDEDGLLRRRRVRPRTRQVYMEAIKEFEEVMSVKHMTLTAERADYLMDRYIVAFLEDGRVGRGGALRPVRALLEADAPHSFSFDYASFQGISCGLRSGSPRQYEGSRPLEGCSSSGLGVGEDREHGEPVLLGVPFDSLRYVRASLGDVGRKEIRLFTASAEFTGASAVLGDHRCALDGDGYYENANAGRHCAFGFGQRGQVMVEGCDEGFTQRSLDSDDAPCSPHAQYGREVGD